jgi:lysophospholipase L1-like esterase
MKIGRLFKIFIAVGICFLFASAIKEEKKVLIIGDSISMGYTPFVTESLSSKATVAHNEGNGGPSARGVERIDKWLGDTKWDVIFFNFGLHDLYYTNAEGKRDKVNGKVSNTLDGYEKNMNIVVEKLKKTGAKLIFATTTMVPPEEPGRKTEEVALYNEVALKIMKKNKIEVVDLYKLSQTVHPQYGQGNNNVHYKPEGYKELAKTVTAAIEKALKLNK